MSDSAEENKFEGRNMPGTTFHNVNLGNAHFDDVNLSGAIFHDINFSDVAFSAAQMGGATFKHIGLPRDAKGTQRGLAFENAELNGSAFVDCDLRDVKIENCTLDGMTIDGIAVADLLAAYKTREL